MRIVYAVPGVLPPEEADRRRGLLREWASPGTEADLVCVREGPASIESQYEEYLSIRPTAELILELERQGYDAALLGCAGDPGIDAMREITTKMLVVGPGAASYMAASLLGERYAVLTVEESLIRMIQELARRSGCADKLAKVVAINIPVLELGRDREGVIRLLLDQCRQLMETERVDSFVLGCMSLGFLGVAEEITQRLGVPCVNPARVSLKLAEALVDCGLCHSKRAYATPPKLRDGRVKELDEMYVRVPD